MTYLLLFVIKKIETPQLSTPTFAISLAGSEHELFFETKKLQNIEMGIFVTCLLQIGG